MLCSRMHMHRFATYVPAPAPAPAPDRRMNKNKKRSSNIHINALKCETRAWLGAFDDANDSRSSKSIMRRFLTFLTFLHFLHQSQRSHCFCIHLFRRRRRRATRRKSAKFERLPKYFTSRLAVGSTTRLHCRPGLVHSARCTLHTTHTTRVECNIPSERAVLKLFRVL